MNYRSINPLFTAVCFAFPPLLGSLVSVVWHGGAAMGVVETATGRQGLSRDPVMRAVAWLFVFYVLWNVLAFAVNFTTIHDAIHLVPLATFLLFPFSYSLWAFTTKEDVVETCLVGSAIASYGGLVLALYQFLVLGVRAEGGAGNPLVFAQVVAVAGCICLAAAFQTADKNPRAVLLGAFAASLIAVLLSGSRTDWLIIFLDFLLVTFVFRSQLRAFATRRVVIAAVLFCILLLLLAGPVVWSRVALLFHDWHSVEARGRYSSSLGIRLALWQIGIGLVAAHPIVGYGMHRTTGLIQEGLANGFGIDVGFSHFHNGLLTITVQSGFVGTLTVLAIFVLVTVVAVRVLMREEGTVQKMGAVILLLTVVTYMVAGAFNKLLGHDILDTMFMIYLIVGLYLATGTMSVLPVKASASPAEGADRR